MPKMVKRPDWTGLLNTNFGEKVYYISGATRTKWLWTMKGWWTGSVGHVIVAFYSFKAELLIPGVKLSSGLCFAW